MSTRRPLHLQGGLDLCLAVLLGVGLCHCGPASPPPESATEADRASTEAEPWFVEISSDVGIDFVHRDGRSGQRFYVETAASGGGWVDFDGDGDLDIYLVNGAATPGSDGEVTTHPPRNALFENRGDHFVDVTDAAGVGDTGYGMGICAGDYDADGRLDLFVTNYGADRLFRGVMKPGVGIGFEEVSEAAGVAGEKWGTNCVFADIDQDGDLDLYVANYVDFRYADNPRCGDVTRDVWSYCRPAVFEGQPDDLYINQGDGTFRQEAGRRGIDQGTEDRGFGVIASDLTGDGAPELLVANDGTMNRFYVNDGRGVFTDRALASGLASNQSGQAESGMGLALGDADGDGRADLLVTNYSFETNTLYRQLDGLYFEDYTAQSGLGKPSFLKVGWGVAFFDFDNDADLDVAVANGHVMDTIDQFETGIGYPQASSLYINDGGGRFRDATDEAGPAFAALEVSRALAVGDWNGDGRLDLLVTNTNGSVDLLENRLATSNHWVGIRLLGSASNPLAIGARAVLSCGGATVGEREVRSGGSYLAQSDLRLHFGLGDCTGPLALDVRWPSGEVQQTRIDEIDAYLDVRHSSGGARPEVD